MRPENCEGCWPASTLLNSTRWRQTQEIKVQRCVVVVCARDSPPRMLCSFGCSYQWLHGLPGSLTGNSSLAGSGSSGSMPNTPATLDHHLSPCALTSIQQRLSRIWEPLHLITPLTSLDLRFVCCSILAGPAVFQSPCFLHLFVSTQPRRTSSSLAV
jgi:hypothetical protein